MKHSNPIERAVTLLIISVFVICGILSFVRHYDKAYSPMNSHVEYILEKHNDSCHYEMGECPQFECSHYGQPIPANKIIKQTTDDRGLISVVYHQNGEDWGLDYITRSEYDSLINVLNPRN